MQDVPLDHSQVLNQTALSCRFIKLIHETLVNFQRPRYNAKHCSRTKHQQNNVKQSNLAMAPLRIEDVEAARSVVENRNIRDPRRYEPDGFAWGQQFTDKDVLNKFADGGLTCQRTLENASREIVHCTISGTSIDASTSLPFCRKPW